MREAEERSLLAGPHRELVPAWRHLPADRANPKSWLRQQIAGGSFLTGDCTGGFISEVTYQSTFRTSHQRQVECYGVVACPPLPIPPVCLYRLDARPGLCSDVSDPLLRLLAESRRRPERAVHVLATGRNLPSAAISISGWRFNRTGNRKAVEEEFASGANCSCHHPPRRRNLRVRPALPFPGIHHRPGAGRR
jgi:hypothetical protein